MNKIKILRDAIKNNKRNHVEKQNYYNTNQIICHD